MTTLWISYKGKKYKKIAKYEDFVAATGQMLKFIQDHTERGDRVKLVYTKRD
jgi:hypothetical protein